MKISNNLMADSVFEGGGVKGIGLVVAVTEEGGYQWVNIAGTSAGAIVAALLAAGYSAAEMKQIVAELDHNNFKDAGPLDRVPKVWEQPNLTSLERRVRRCINLAGKPQKRFLIPGILPSM